MGPVKIVLRAANLVIIFKSEVILLIIAFLECPHRDYASFLASAIMSSSLVVGYSPSGGESFRD